MPVLPVPRRHFLLALGLLPLLSACVPAVIVTGAAVGVVSYHDRRSTGTQADDETTEWRARNRLPAVWRERGNVNFTAYNRRVLVSGEVPDERAREEIGALAAALDGVQKVHNELRIGPVSTVGERADDVLLSSRIKARLLDQKVVSSNHVKPVSERGVVFLMGIVSEAEAQAAIEVVRTTAGVAKVVSLFEILPASDIRRLDNQAFGSSR
ncbi:BON domain-containing protein [Dechloromonas sp.]|uniref:BON domain-containing protein n=1 Tax=Dechloromonas sp. TaxID=1917218 RepID=UPI0012270989|nr:BON domain-containing protein [Dechloromonas sp.]MBU3698156.1 BON domain-containing protein [Dechloromonas sp.]TEX44453.1 MAG: transporter [Rhodocyclaceae bacterium]